MAFFGRKNEEDEYEDIDELEEESRERKLTRKFKDLRPENKRKRKEPPKPWGKKERLIVLIVLATTAVVAAVLAYSSGTKGGVHFNLPKFDLKSLNIFKEETIIIEKK